MDKERDIVRKHLVWLLESGNAHSSFEDVIARVSAKARGKRPAGLPYSAWELLEHIRLAQRDILEFCVDADYRERRWPEDYWPEEAAPPDERAWEASVRQVKEDRAALINMVKDGGVDPLGRLPSGADKTPMREAMLAADHLAYHLGQLVVVLRLLGAWPGK